MMTSFIFSGHAFGDSLITLAALERLAADTPAFKIFGTAITAQVSALTRCKLPVIQLLPHEAALYTLRAQGLRRALSDLSRLRAGIARHMRTGDLLAFEFPDRRSRLVVPFGCRAIYGAKAENAYEDRRELIRTAIADPGPWEPAPVLPHKITRVLVNPCARHVSRHVAPATIAAVIGVAQRHSWELTLLDPCRRYGDFREQVDHYVPAPALPKAAALLRNSQLYLGPDSFFIHLAYYYGVPTFGFYLAHHLPYLAPGTRESGAWCTFETARDPRRFERALEGFIERGSLPQRLAS